MDERRTKVRKKQYGRKGKGRVDKKCRNGRRKKKKEGRKQDGSREWRRGVAGEKKEKEKENK